MTQLLIFHGETIVAGLLIQLLLGLLGAIACIYGVLKYRSLPAIVIAFSYFVMTLLSALLFFRAGILPFETVALALTLPWNLIMPCFDSYLGPCRLSLGGAFICAELNAAVLYYLVAWKSRPDRKGLS